MKLKLTGDSKKDLIQLVALCKASNDPVEVSSMIRGYHDHYFSVGDEYEMPFGKHKGKPLRLVPADYFDWCEENIHDLDTKFPEVYQYIQQSRQHLDQEQEESADDVPSFLQADDDEVPF